MCFFLNSNNPTRYTHYKSDSAYKELKPYKAWSIPYKRQIYTWKKFEHSSEITAIHLHELI